MITSRQNTLIKETAKLLKGKERRKTGRFLVEGQHMIEEAIQAECLETLFTLEDSTLSWDGKIIYCTQEVLDKLSLQSSHSQCIGLCKQPDQSADIHRVLLLDRIQDPGNMGTLIRCAYSFGFHTIYCSNDCVDIFNPKVLQASQGSIFHVAIHSVNLKEQIHSLKETHHLYATALSASTSPLADVSPSLDYGIILGNEGSGVSQDILALVDDHVKIEMDAFESLNVAIAGGIAMYTLRQKEKE